jgi:hypothetical protein
MYLFRHIFYSPTQVRAYAGKTSNLDLAVALFRNLALERRHEIFTVFHLSSRRLPSTMSSPNEEHAVIRAAYDPRHGDDMAKMAG